MVGPAVHAGMPCSRQWCLVVKIVICPGERSSWPSSARKPIFVLISQGTADTEDSILHAITAIFNEVREKRHRDKEAYQETQEHVER